MLLIDTHKNWVQEKRNPDNKNNPSNLGLFLVKFPHALLECKETLTPSRDQYFVQSSLMHNLCMGS